MPHEVPSPISSANSPAARSAQGSPMSPAGKNGETMSLDVSIMGREYRVACKPNEKQELLDAVAYVDRQMRMIRDTGKQNNAERVAVMAALNIAHDLLKVRVA